MIIRKPIVISRVNRIRRVSWCRQKLTWNVKDHWERVIFTDETQLVIGQKSLFGEDRMKSGSQFVLVEVEVEKYLLCSGVVFPTLAWYFTI